MLRQMFHGKIHRATITDTNLNYEGSVTIDAKLLDASGILPGERVQIVNVNNGTRVETYVLLGEPGSGDVVLNGAAARWAEPGDKVIIIGYALCTDEEARSLEPAVVKVDERNRIFGD